MLRLCYNINEKYTQFELNYTLRFFLTLGKYSFKITIRGIYYGKIITQRIKYDTDQINSMDDEAENEFYERWTDIYDE